MCKNTNYKIEVKEHKKQYNRNYSVYSKKQDGIHCGALDSVITHKSKVLIQLRCFDNLLGNIHASAAVSLDLVINRNEPPR